MKLSVFLLIVTVFCIHQISEAQNKKKLYYSKYWEITTADSAQYYRVCTLDTVKYLFIGEVTDYLVNEQLMMTGAYSNGQKNGEFTLYYPNGQVESQGEFKDNKRFGLWKYYFSNGKTQREVTFTGDDFFVNKLYDANDKILVDSGTGEWFYEYEWQRLPTKIMVRGNFVDGKKEGKWKCTTSNGDVVYKETFKANKFQKGVQSFNGEEGPYFTEHPNKFLIPYKFESTENFLFLDFVKRDRYPYLGFLPRPVAITNEIADEGVIFSMAEEPPTFVGGTSLFYEFVARNIRYPSEARKRGIQGKVFVEFIINKDGTLSEIKTIKGIGGECDEEAVRVVSLSPPWNPGMQRGKAVRTRFVIPISFRLGN